jgi:hypothetical protein
VGNIVTFDKLARFRRQLEVKHFKSRPATYESDAFISDQLMWPVARVRGVEVRDICEFVSAIITEAGKQSAGVGQKDQI